MKKFFRKTFLLALAAVLSYGFMSCSDSGDEGNYYEKSVSSSSSGSSSTTKTTYTVTFNANGGSGSMSSQTFTAGVAQALSKNTFTAPSDNKTFAGWATTAGGKRVYTDGASYTATDNVTLYAVWTENGVATTYTIKHYKQTGGLTSASYKEVTADETTGIAGISGTYTDVKSYVTTKQADSAYSNYTPDYEDVVILAEEATVVNIYWNLISANSISGIETSVADVEDLTLTLDSDTDLQASKRTITVSGKYIDLLYSAAQIDEDVEDAVSSYFVWYLNGTQCTTNSATRTGFDKNGAVEMTVGSLGDLIDGTNVITLILKQIKTSTDPIKKYTAGPVKQTITISN